MSLLILSRLRKGATVIVSIVGQVKANGNQCKRLSERINYVIEHIFNQSDVLQQYPETTEALERLEIIIRRCQDFIQEFVNDSTWFEKIFYHQNYKEKFASLNQQIEQCTNDLHLSVNLKILSDRQQDENDQQKDMDDIRTKLDEISQLMVGQQENIEDLLNRRFNSFRYHLDQNIRRTTDVHVAQAMEQQTKLFLPIPFYDLRVEERIGQGGYADVYRGVWLSQHQQVAIKIIRLTYLTDNVNQEFMREISTMYKIRCDHVLNVFGACMEPQVYALVIEYMELGSLFDILKRKEIQFTWPDRWSIALQMAKGINYLHHLQPPVVHRDIKSLNFLLKEGVRQQFVVKVGDFGVADIKEETIRQTMTNNTAPSSLAGTVQWLAPELLRLGRPTLASDVFALAVVFWELATGCVPYEHCKESAIRLAVCDGKRLAIPNGVPKQFRNIITQAWAQDPNKRSTCPMIISAISRSITATADPLRTIASNIDEDAAQTLTTFNINEHQVDSSPPADLQEAASGRVITFVNIPDAVQNDKKLIPKGHENFSWTNLYYVHIKYAHIMQSKNSSLLRAFQSLRDSSSWVALNSTCSSPVLIQCTDEKNTFNIRGVVANSIYREQIQLVLIGRRNGEQVGTATFILSRDSQRFSILDERLDGIDQLEFRTESASSDTYSNFASPGRRYLFALTCLYL